MTCGGKIGPRVPSSAKAIASGAEGNGPDGQPNHRHGRKAAGTTPRGPGLDVKARELAGQYPALGIGRGFEQGTGYDDTDYAGGLWDLLRAGCPTREAAA